MESGVDIEVARDGARVTRVLIIEDDAAIAEMYKLALELAGFAVTVASSGEDGLRAAVATPADTIVLDIGLPDIDGVEVLRRLSGERPALTAPVLVLSNVDEPELVARALAGGAASYQVKSHTSPHVLGELITTLVAHQAAVRPLQGGLGESFDMAAV
jgi:DNA-binding response OmpR family regulator